MAILLLYMIKPGLLRMSDFSSHLEEIGIARGRVLSTDNDVGGDVSVAVLLREVSRVVGEARRSEL